MTTRKFYAKYFLVIILIFAGAVASAVAAKHMWDLVIDNNLTVGGVTPSAVEWGFVDVNDQSVATSTSPTFQGFNMGEVATPSTPASANNKLYFKNDAKLYKLDDTGLEKQVGGGGGGSAGVDLLAAENGNCEDGDPPLNWVNSGATFVAETAAPGFDAQSCSWDASATAQTLQTATVVIPDALQGASCAAEYWYKWAGVDGDITVRIEDGAGVEINASSSGNLVVSAGWVKTDLTFICPLSGSMRIEWTSTADAAVLLVDNAKLGENVLIKVTTNTTAQSYTPDIVGFGTETSVAFTWSQDGIYMDVVGAFTAGTPAASEAQIPLPLGFTIAATAPTAGGAANAGVYIRNASVAGHGGAVLMTAGDAFVNMGHSQTFGATSVNPGSPAIGTAVSSTSQRMTVQFRVPIQEFSASVSAFRADQTNRPWTAYDPIFTGFGIAANVTAFHKRQGEDLLLDVTFDCGAPTATEARISFPGSLSSKSNLATISLAGTSGFDAGSASVFGFSVLKEASVSYVTVGRQESGDGDLNKKNGSSLCTVGQMMSFNARIPIESWNETMNAPLIKQAIVNGGSGVTRFFDASFGGAIEGTNNCTASPCIIYRQSGGITSITRNGIGNYTVNVEAGLCTGSLICTGAGVSIGLAALNFAKDESVPTTTASTMRFHDLTLPVARDAFVDLRCSCNF